MILLVFYYKAMSIHATVYVWKSRMFFCAPLKPFKVAYHYTAKKNLITLFGNIYCAN